MPDTRPTIIDFRAAGMRVVLPGEIVGGCA
jgi:hypothetical protein